MTFHPVYFLWHIVIATLFIIGAYSLAVGIKARQHSFLYYTAYSFLLLIYLVMKSPYLSDSFEEAIYNSKWNVLYWGIQVIYNLVYFYFFLHFLEVKNHLPKYYKWLQKAINSIFLVSMVIAFISVFSSNSEIFRFYFISIFTPIITITAFRVLVKTFSLPGQLKYFFISGSSFYLIMALVALVWSVSVDTFTVKTWAVPMVFFYSGIFIEQLAFGLGLSYRIHIINQKLIEASRKNEQMEHDMNQKLNRKLKEKESALLKISQEAEQRKIDTIKNQFENKIHEIQLSSLQSKMNPHFIFNALNSIKVFLIENDKEMAVSYMNKFSKLIRKILEGSRVESFSLKEELDILQLYLSIENNRFEDNINFTTPELSPSHAAIKVPPLILQPFVENAIWHGLLLSDKPKKIDIKLKEEDNKTVIEIVDNGVGRAYSRNKKKRKNLSRKSIGLKITQERIDHFNHKHDTGYFFKILDLKDQDGKPSGTKVSFFLEKTT